MLNELSLDPQTFIGGWYIDPEICQGVVKTFNEHQELHQPGTVSRDGQLSVDPEIKASTDLQVFRNPDIPEIQVYLQALGQCCDLYKARYPTLDRVSPWAIAENFNIQHYDHTENQAYHNWHSERMGVNPPVSSRMLAWMTYLNTVKDGGETEFYHQDLKIKPEAGLTLIWPVDWTHTHRGLPSATEDKMIITGWYSYVDNPGQLQLLPAS